MKHALYSLLALAFGATLLTPTAPVQAEVNFKGKTLTMVIPSRPGGGTDSIGRVVAAGMAKYLPGSPDLIFKNIPAGEGTKALNYFVEKVQPDGITFATSSGSQVYADTMRRKTVRYDPGKFNFIGHLPAPGGVVLMPKAMLGRLKDKSQPPLIFGGIRGTRGQSQMAIWGPAFLGWNIRWVVGYQGSSGMNLAFERGETQVTANTNFSVIDPFLKSGTYVAISQTGLIKGKDSTRSLLYPDVPLFHKMILPKLDSPEAKSAFRAWWTMVQVGKYFMLPPKTSAEVVKIYRAAFHKAMADKDIDRQVKALWSPVYTVSTGPEMLELVQDIKKITDEDLSFIDRIRNSVGIPLGVGRNRVVRSTISAIDKGGRSISFKVRKGRTHKVKVSGNKTKITVNGKPAKRSALKAGMTCRFIYPKKNKTAQSIAC
ncbi:MAG: tripartite-type tricarboxylate transporter receptor subunit TctC [Alphaproteobacteria bacterium]|jgi:tripartite-type tricarboxylate transporter receptor subunit TctC